MIVMEYMGNGVLDSFLRVSAGLVCWALPLAWASLTFGFSSFFTETRGTVHGRPAPVHAAGHCLWHEVPGRDGVHT